MIEDPVLYKFCMHRFCRECLNKYRGKKESRECPICRVNVETRRELKDDSTLLKILNHLKLEFEKIKVCDEQEEAWVKAKKDKEILRAKLAKARNSLLIKNEPKESALTVAGEEGKEETTKSKGISSSTCARMQTKAEQEKAKNYPENLVKPEHVLQIIEQKR